MIGDFNLPMDHPGNGIWMPTFCYFLMVLVHVYRGKIPYIHPMGYDILIYEY